MIFKKRFSEKRQYRRRDCHCLVKYKSFDKESSCMETTTSIRNISEGGILLKTKEYLPMDCKLELKINIPTMNEVIDVTAKVVRVQELKRGEGYQIGVMFLDVGPKHKEKIAKFSALGKKSK